MEDREFYIHIGKCIIKYYKAIEFCDKIILIPFLIITQVTYEIAVIFMPQY